MWEDRLVDYNGDEPLDVWREYIKWLRRNNLTGDLRFLRVCVKQIDNMNDTAGIFELLEINFIGRNLALFYTSWAAVLEFKRGIYTEAYMKLDQGLRLKARPVEQLRDALKNLEHRINQRTNEMMQNAALESKPDEEQTEALDKEDDFEAPPPEIEEEARALFAVL